MDLAGNAPSAPKASEGFKNQFSESEKLVELKLKGVPWRFLVAIPAPTSPGVYS